MKQIKIISLFLCIILAGCATSGPKQETVDKPLKPEKTEKAETPQTTTPTTTPRAVAPNDPYGGRSLPYGLSFGMSKKQVTDILTKVAGGPPRAQGNALVWDGPISRNPIIVLVLAAVFENNKMIAFDFANYGKKTDEVYKRIEAGFNTKLKELKSSHTLRDSQITQYRRVVLFETREGHFLVLTLQTDDKQGLYIINLKHLEKLPQK